MGPHVTLLGLSEFRLVSSEPTGQERSLELKWGRGTAHLALATHSMVTSEVPVTTLVFLGGMMMVGAMGSAGLPTSGERTGVSWEQRPEIPPPFRGMPRETFVLTEGGQVAMGQTPQQPQSRTSRHGPRGPFHLLC